MKNTRKKEIQETGSEIREEDKKETTEQGPASRKWLMLFMILCSLLESGISGWASRLPLDRLLALMFLGIFYSVLFVTGVELYRIQQEWFSQKIGNCKHLALCYGICSALAVLFLYLPEFARPLLLIGVIMGMAGDPFLGIAAGLFHPVVYVFCGQGSIYVLLCQLLLLLCGSLAVVFLGKKEYMHWGILFLFQFTFGSIMLFSYLQTGQLELDMIIYGLCSGILCSVGAYFLYMNFGKKMYVQRESGVSMEVEEEVKAAPQRQPLFRPGAETEIKTGFALEIILSQEFELYQALKDFSRADYLHAKKVSEIAENCARLVGADSRVAAAGGFYYRLGRMEGEPFVDNGVALAKSYWFPQEVINILEEYNGEQKLPSTVESALVHIVDSVVGKMEVLGKKALTSSWNRDIVVYQTLNESSAEGLYDKSGFTMNMFLKIRDYLIKEANMF